MKKLNSNKKKIISLAKILNNLVIAKAVYHDGRLKLLEISS